MQLDEINWWAWQQNDTADIHEIRHLSDINRTDTSYTHRVYWDFESDGLVDDSGSWPAHVYNTPGLYTVTMISRDSTGQFDTCRAQVNIGGAVARVLPLQARILCGDTASFIDSSYVMLFAGAHDSIVKREWKYVDSSDRHNARLIIHSEQGCMDTAVADVFVERPSAYFTLGGNASKCLPYQLQFINRADRYRANVLDTLTKWTVIDWGDGSMAYRAGISDTIWHEYTQPGTFSISVRSANDSPKTTVCHGIYPDTSLGQMPVTITVQPPGLNDLTGPQSVAVDSTVVYSVVNHLNGMFTWSADSGEFSSNIHSFTVQMKWLRPGINTLRVALNANGCTYQKEIQVLALRTGLDEAGLAADVKVFPNPASTFLTVQYQPGAHGNQIVWITDLQGRIVFETQIQPGIGSGETTIPLAGIPEGMYLLKAAPGNIRKIVIAR
jgi:PKD repeat protein